MKVILISSMKGGSGVTSLTILIAKYLYTNHYKIALLDFSSINLLAPFFREENPCFRHYNAKQPDAAGRINTIREEDTAYDFLLIDGPKDPTPSWLYLHQVADLIIVPYQFGTLDFLHLKAYWVYLRREPSIQAPVYFSANKYSEKRKKQSLEQLKDMHHGKDCYFPPLILSLPDIPFAAKITGNPFHFNYTEQEIIRSTGLQIISLTQ